MYVSVFLCWVHYLAENETGKTSRLADVGVRENIKREGKAYFPQGKHSNGGGGLITPVERHLLVCAASHGSGTRCR